MKPRAHRRTVSKCFSRSGHLTTLLLLAGFVWFPSEIVAAPPVDPSPSDEASEPSSSPFDLPRTRLSEAKVREEIRLLQTALTNIHPGTERFAGPEEMASAWERMAELAAGGTTDVEFYLEVQRLLATVRCDHTKAEIPDSWVNWLETNPTYLPLRLEIYGDRAFVAASDPEQPQVRIGSELIAVNGRLTADILKAVRPLVAVDGYTDHVKDLELGNSSEYQGPAFDHFAQLMFGASRKYGLTLADEDGKTTTVDVDALTYPRWLEIATAAGKRYVNFKDEVDWHFLDDETGYLRIGTFVNYREPVDPDTALRPLFVALRERSARRLIVDLRDNGGGSTEPGLSLLRFLMREPFVWNWPSRMKFTDYGELKPYLSSWDDAILNPQRSWFIERDGWYELKEDDGGKTIQPHEDGFDGDVVVLIGPANSSGSTHVIAKLVDSGRVRTVGGKTGGNPRGATAGSLVFMNLPHSGITVRIPLQRIVLNVTTLEDGRPIHPDVLIERSPAERFKTGDRVLEAARALAPRSRPD